jgi:putative phosphoesterase
VIAVLGDTHLPRGSRRLPDACVRLLSDADLILHVGDFTAVSVLEELRTLAPVAAVHGNVDEWPLREALPERLLVEHDGLRLGLVHDAGPAAGRHGRLAAAFPGCDVVAYGHTHEPELARVDGLWILNAGSPTERRRSPRHTMAVIDDGDPRLVRL